MFFAYREETPALAQEVRVEELSVEFALHVGEAHKDGVLVLARHVLPDGVVVATVHERLYTIGESRLCI